MIVKKTTEPVLPNNCLECMDESSTCMMFDASGELPQDCPLMELPDRECAIGIMKDFIQHDYPKGTGVSMLADRLGFKKENT